MTKEERHRFRNDVGEGWRPIVDSLLHYIDECHELPYNGGRYFRPGTRRIVEWLWRHWSFPPFWVGDWARNLRYRFIHWALTAPDGTVPTAYVGHAQGFTPEVMQVKEKFGGLRFYTDYSNDYLNGMIHMAECISYKTCEQCGKPGKPRSGGWVLTLCDDCEKARGERR